MGNKCHTYWILFLIYNRKKCGAIGVEWKITLLGVRGAFSFCFYGEGISEPKM